MKSISVHDSSIVGVINSILVMFRSSYDVTLERKPRSAQTTVSLKGRVRCYLVADGEEERMAR